MKKNGQSQTETYAFDDARVGWRTTSRRLGSRDMCRALDAWLEKKGLNTKKRPFGSYQK
jgi:hypothetical protein